MKKNTKENLKIAKQYFKASFSKENLDIRKVRALVGHIKKSSKGNALNILKIYLSLLNKYFQERTVIVESAGDISKNVVEKIRRNFERSEGRKLDIKLKKNPQVLGGLRVTLSDTQWDYSLKGKINQMKEALSDRYSN
ncbi:MAG: hypothetical protein A2Z42_01320 [Candidatus Woykebacteria bacterium RBG_19FT_COMBO_43_10]|uniref:Uncharacterized protein n=1 Tax=Candidatus Woykebacteria bacterium RBG_19FT_COMBO_43_10 TaxID=1802598 RepID=A0A1G1WKL5_9BACT|nr:MAG: hypothetical protein A2Z42_01320 [Candidatus Woykebacteria bacterium RBG_19FT_COMBO_43_10]